MKKMLNEVLRLLRITYDFKANEFAKKLGISAPYLSEIETGKKSPSLDVIKLYSDLLKIPASSILFFEEESEKKGLKGSAKIFIQQKIIEFMQEADTIEEEESLPH